MTNKKSMKRALISSLLVMAMCFSMLVGTTFAWFTDSVTSAGNVIKSGTLDIAFQWANGTEVVADANWQDASQGAIFNYDLWEPGYVSARHVRIANVGNLALKYKFAIQVNGELEVNSEGHTLADAIDVYYADPAVKVADRDFEGLTNLGALSTVLGSFDATGSGVLLPDDDDTVTIVLKMREEAGNEYQDMEIGASFSIQLLATQYTYENDSFDKLYDDDAVLPEVRTVAAATVTNGAANFTAYEAPADNKTTTVAITGVAAEEDDNLTLSVDTADFETAKTAFTVEANHTAVAGIDLTLEKNGTKVTFGEGEATVTTYILPGLDPAKVSVKYNGEGDAPTFVSYEAETGKLVFKTSHFSEFYADYAGMFAYLPQTGRAYIEVDDLYEAVYSVSEAAVTNISKIEIYDSSDIASFLFGGYQGYGFNPDWYYDSDMLDSVAEGTTEAEVKEMMTQYVTAYEACKDAIEYYNRPHGPSTPWISYPMGVDEGEW